MADEILGEWTVISKARALVVGLALATGVVLAGCGGDEVIRPTVSVSVGQQLIDLKKARDTGALSQADYESQKKKLIETVK